MAKCPECKNEIKTLAYRCTSISGGTFSIDKNGWGDCSEDYDEPQSYEYYCPECGGNVFSDETAAISFLKGGGHGNHSA